MVTCRPVSTPAKLLSNAALLLALSRALVGCGGAEVSDTDTATPVVQVDPKTLQDSVTYSLSPTRSKEVYSVDGNGLPDGVLTIRINPRAVRRDASITIARIAEAYRPKGVVGDAFLLSPEITTLDQPIRLRIRLDPAEVSDPSFLRLARLDTGDRFYRAASGQAVVSDASLTFAGGETLTFGVFAVVDTREIEIRDDVAPTDLWAGMHYLDLGAVRAADERFQSAVAEDPQSPTAAFAAGLTRFLRLPELPQLATFFAACGQPAWNVDEVFGAGGTIDRLISQVVGPSQVTAAVGFDEQNAVTHVLNPTKVSAKRVEHGVCLDGVSGAFVSDGHWLLEVVDPDLGGSGAQLDVELRVDPSKPQTGSDATLTELVAASGTGYAEIPVSDLNGQLLAYRDETSGDGDTESTTAEEPLRPSPDAPGVLRFYSAATAAGETVILDFADVTLLPPLDSTIPEVVVLQGRVEPVLAGEIAEQELPVFNEASIQGLLARCDPSALPQLDQAYLRSLATAIATEADAIADLWLLASRDPGFRFDISMGLVASPGRVPVGAAEAGILAAALKLLVVGANLVGEYELFAGDLRDLLIDVEVEHFQTCDPCTNQICSTTSQTEPLFGAQLTVDALEGVFLNRTSQSPLATAEQALRDAIQGLRNALASTSVDTVIVMQRAGASTATSALDELLDILETGLDAASHLDGARVFFDSGDGLVNLFLTLGNFLDTPPTESSLRVEHEIDPGEPTWTVGVADGKDCPDPCTNEAALVPVSADWFLSGFLLEAVTLEVECDEPSQCGAGADCVDNTCEFPSTEDHLTPLLDAFQDMPPFFNEKALTEVEALVW